MESMGDTQLNSETDSGDDDGDTTRAHPDVDLELYDDFKTTIAAFNEGKVKGRLSPAFEEAMEAYIVIMFLRSPYHLKQLENHVNADNVDDPDAFRDRVTTKYINRVDDSFIEAVDHLPPEDVRRRNEPGQILDAMLSGGFLDDGGTDNQEGDESLEDQSRKLVRSELLKLIRDDDTIQKELMMLVKDSMFGSGAQPATNGTS